MKDIKIKPPVPVEEPDFDDKFLGIAAAKGALINNAIRPGVKIGTLGVMASPKVPPAPGAAAKAAVDRGNGPSGHPSPPEKTAPSIKDVVDTLRNGGVLDAASMAVIADGINARFEQLRSRWGGKLYFSSAEVRLFDDRDPRDPDPDYTVTYLAFRKQDKGWNFVLEEIYSGDPDGDASTVPLASAPLDVRIRAIEALPELEAQLKKQRDTLTKSLIKAYDSLTSLVEQSTKPDTEGGHGSR